MFRIDSFDVIDATTSGDAARFINHSCEVRRGILFFALSKLLRKLQPRTFSRAEWCCMRNCFCLIFGIYFFFFSQTVFHV